MKGRCILQWKVASHKTVLKCPWTRHWIPNACRGVASLPGLCSVNIHPSSTESSLFWFYNIKTSLFCVMLDDGENWDISFKDPFMSDTQLMTYRWLWRWFGCDNWSDWIGPGLYLNLALFLQRYFTSSSLCSLYSLQCRASSSNKSVCFVFSFFYSFYKKMKCLSAVGNSSCYWPVRMLSRVYSAISCVLLPDRQWLDFFSWKYI